MVDDSHTTAIPYSGSLTALPDPLFILIDPQEAKSQAAGTEVVPAAIGQGETDLVPIFSGLEIAREFVGSQGLTLEPAEKSRESLQTWGILLSSVSKRRIMYVLNPRDIERLKHPQAES